MNTITLKETFLLKAIAHGEAINLGNYKEANKIHKSLHELYRTAKATNQLSVFKEMLKEKDENVRLSAATFSLIHSPDLARNTLNELSKLSTITAMSAKTTLQLWDEGKLDLI